MEWGEVLRAGLSGALQSVHGTFIAAANISLRRVELVAGKGCRCHYSGPEGGTNKFSGFFCGATPQTF